MSYVLMWLEAPLQSWGFDSRYGNRDTLGFPTKSGLIGLILCAMGKGGTQEDLMERFESLDLVLGEYPLVRQNHTVKLRDFHTVGNGYDEEDPWQNLMIPKTSDGSKAKNATGSKLTYRSYLQDKAFAAALELPPGMEREICNALKNPVWTLYLGRKACLPTEIIYQGLFDSSEAALKRADTIADEKTRKCSRKIFSKGKDNSGSDFVLNDNPVSFGTRKIYKSRKVTIVEIDDFQNSTQKKRHAKDFP